MSTPKFSDVFKERVARLEADMAEVGLNWTAACRKAKVSRATPDRWRKATPKTVELIDKFEAVVAKAREDQAKQQTQAG